MSPAEGPDTRLSESTFSADQCPHPAQGTSRGEPSAGGDRDGERPPEGGAEQRSLAPPDQGWPQGCAGPGLAVDFLTGKGVFQSLDTSVLLFFNFFYF